MIDGQIFFYPMLVGIITLIVFLISAFHVIQLRTSEFQDEKGPIMKVCPALVYINIVVISWFLIVMFNYTFAREMKVNVTLGNTGTSGRSTKTGTHHTHYVEVFTDDNKNYYLKLKFEDLSYLRGIPNTPKHNLTLCIRKGIFCTIVRSIEDKNRRMKYYDW